MDWLRGFFKDQDVYIVGGGASLYEFFKAGNFSRLEDKRVIAVNHSYMYVKHDILVFLDGKFHKEVKARGDNFENMDCRIITGPSGGLQTKDHITMFHLAPQPSENPNYLFGRAQSGLIAINAAIVGEAKNIYLLGYDCGFIKGRGHFYSDEWTHAQDKNQAAYKRPLNDYKKFAKYKNIFNCSPASAITVFPKIELESVL